MTRAETLTLADFLLARIAEDEADARESNEDEWRVHIFDINVTGWFDPARVLAESAAKRRVIEEFAPVVDEGGDGEYRLASVFRLLALPYADHPDYRNEWRP